MKVCGITSLEDALVAVRAGADALGFIFVEGTPRFVTPEQVAPIVRSLPPFVTPVGVFWDHPRGQVKAVAQSCGLQALQLHGDEGPDDVEGYEWPVIKTVKLRPEAGRAAVPAAVAAYRARGVAAVLLDSAARWSEGEARAPIAWDVARACAADGPVVLAAGLTPDNVAQAVAMARPWAVDVNSGVETRPGRKDPAKVERFVAAAKRAR